MRNTEFYFVTNYCWENGIFIVVKPVNNAGKYRLAISRNGKEKTGHQIYQDKPSKNIIPEFGPDGNKKNTTEKVPALHQKIEELYIDIYRKNCTEKPFKKNFKDLEEKIELIPIPGFPTFFKTEKILV